MKRHDTTRHDTTQDRIQYHTTQFYNTLHNTTQQHPKRHDMTSKHNSGQVTITLHFIRILHEYNSEHKMYVIISLYSRRHQQKRYKAEQRREMHNNHGC